jgi:hypothetical protein
VAHEQHLVVAREDAYGAALRGAHDDPVDAQNPVPDPVRSAQKGIPSNH